MPIKNDLWIKRMALEQRMIEPFAEEQVSRGVISYGLSSYGYDMRIADEFKIFTDINTTVVDPKAFDPRSFVEYKGDVCIIPPNSFALGRSVEYFRIPRNVLTLCVGKCLAGETRVVDAETGAYLPIAEFASSRATFGLRGGAIQRLPVSAHLRQGRKPVYELTTRLGLKVRATRNHPFRQLGGWTSLADLRPGDRIAVAREVPIFGKTPIADWEAILLGLMISEGQCYTPGHSPVFTNSDPILVSLLEECATAGLGCKVVWKGRYGYRLVNRRGHGGIMKANRASLWLSEHGLRVKARDKFVPQAIFRAPETSVTRFLRSLFSGDGTIYAQGKAVFLEYTSMSRRLVEDVHHLLLRYGIISLIREKRTQFGTTAYRIQLTDRDHIRRFAERIGFWEGSEKQLRLEQEILPILVKHKRKGSNFDTLPREAWELVRQAARSKNRSLRSLGFPRTVPAQSLSLATACQVVSATEDPEVSALVDGDTLWDVVVRIEPTGEAEVYDLTVPGAHNFIANDLFAHNSTYARCGVITNVTPFEPEWEGYVTLEISNTTPLPAKIYANEGIAQVLFLESDELCAISYADRKGKYQAQKGITPPRI